MPARFRRLVPLYRILIDGQDLDPVEADSVHQIKITDWLRLPDVCTLQVGYPADDRGAIRSSRSTTPSSRSARSSRSSWAARTTRVTKTLFKGEIVTVEPDFQAGGVSMVVRAYDRSHRMMRSRKQRTFVRREDLGHRQEGLQRERAQRRR